MRIRSSLFLGIFSVTLAIVMIDSSPSVTRAQTAGGWSIWNIFGAKTEAPAMRASSAPCAAGLKCNSANADPATICGTGKTPVFGDPVTLKSYGECIADGAPRQCYACVLIYTPRQSSSKSAAKTSSSVHRATSTPPAEGYVCRGISASDAQVGTDCAALGMKGTRCPEGSQMHWYGQIDPERSACSLSERCTGRWGKCAQETPTTPPPTRPPTNACPDTYTCDLQCTNGQCRKLAVDCFATGQETAGKCGPNNEGSCVRCKPANNNPPPPPSRPGCGDGICTETENAIVCPACTAGAPPQNCQCKKLCAQDCGEVRPPSPPPSNLCGNGTCDAAAGETNQTCPGDCKRPGNCPMPGCAMPPPGCKLERSSELGPDGCPLKPCGSIVCPQTPTPPQNPPPTPPRPQCPVADCSLPRQGCSYVANAEKTANGCPRYPCGKLVCTEQSSAPATQTPDPTVCLSSFSYDANWTPIVGRFNCPLDQHCTTEDGICNPSPGCNGEACAQVCAGTCVKGASRFLEQ